jgi:uncharacterized protein YndB with AHSA1/START domain
MGTSDENFVQLTAWTEPALLERWWTGVGGWVDAKADDDLHVGGRYHLSMRDDGGALHGVFGVYTDVAPPDRLAFTWTWENDPGVNARERGEPRRRRSARCARRDAALAHPPVA